MEDDRNGSDGNDGEDQEWVIVESDGGEVGGRSNCILPSVLLNGDTSSLGVGWGSSLMQRAKTRIYMSLARTPKELPESAYDGEDPLWLMGCMCGSVSVFRERCSRLLWFSYRQGFPSIEPTSLTSDTGWGCVLRAGQMLLANTLARLMTARGKQDVERRLLPWFADLPGTAHPYSVHNIAQLGTLFGIKIGEWFQPSVICKVFKLLVRKYSPLNATFYYAQDRVIYRHNVELLCTRSELHSVHSPRTLTTARETRIHPWRPVIIMAAVRLGVGEALNVTHTSSLQEMFRIPYCVGIVGGKPNASVYIAGMQGNTLFYLDPHFVQPADDATSTFHSSVLKMPISEMDPCFAIGFLCVTQEEFDALCAVLSHLEERDGVSCMISVADQDPEYGLRGGVGPTVDPLAHLVFKSQTTSVHESDD